MRPTPRPVQTAAAAVLFPLLAAAGAVEPDSQPIGCELADRRVTVAVSSHLDPSCTWTRGVEIVASGVVLDCQGARIATTDRRYGILVSAPADVALSDVVVRNCRVEGFLNNVRITREGFRELAAGEEYVHAFSNIVVEDSTIASARGVGVFVDGYVTGVTLRNLRVESSGSAGIYLEAGSKDNVVEGCEIVNNGYVENGPAGQLFEFAGVSFWFWGPGREGLAIDGSRGNRVVGNVFAGNSAGAIFLYKNCGEFVNQRPERWWHRRYGADGNLIEGNTIVGEDVGVWVASRMGENTLPMDCSDPAYFSGPLARVVLDHARDNVVRGNVFRDVAYGVRVEDDGAVVAENEFTGEGAEQAVVVGTRFRTPVLDRPVEGTTIAGNRAAIAGNRNPYRWIHGHRSTTFQGNESFGRPVGWCEGVPPPANPFIFVLAFEPADPENPPTGGPPVPAPPEPLPPCPLACTAPAAVVKPRLAVGRLDTPPGDEALAFTGRMLLPHPFTPPLDPEANGVGIAITDAAGGTLVDLVVPGGGFDALTRAGWRAVPSRGRWRYVNRSPDPPGGITSVAVKDLSTRRPGLVRFAVRGRRGGFPIDPAQLPLTALFALDPPTAETGQCVVPRFPSAVSRCARSARALRCR